MNDELQKYVVQEVTHEVPSVTTLSLTNEDGTVPYYLPGQYINVYFPKSSAPEGKAYSISSSPNEPFFTITVRDIGEFSGRLSSMKKGDIIEGSLPYGFFRPESDQTELIMLAAGIGVTPLRSIIRHEARNGFTRPVSLFHSIRTSQDAIFNEEFSDYAHNHDNFTLKQFITREDSFGLINARKGRIDIPSILKEIQSSENMEFLICGSVPFTRDMWKSLKEHGIPEDYIYTEAFFSH